MNKLIKQILFLICLVAILILPYFVFAQNAALNKLKDVGPASGFTSLEEGKEATAFPEFLGTVVSALLSLLGVIFIGLMIYGGYNWMIARGDEAKVTKAQDTIRRAVIGLIIVISSYAIWNFIFIKLIFST